MEQENEIHINDLIATNCRLTNEIISAKSLLAEKDKKIIKAYESLYVKQLNCNRMERIIEGHINTIANLNTEIKRAKIEAFGNDLMNFGRLCHGYV